MTTKFDVDEWQIYQGNTETKVLSCWANAAHTLAFDLSGYSITCQARETEDSASVLFTVGCTNSVGGCNYESGVVAVTFPAVHTSKITKGAVADVLAVLSDIKTTLAKFRLVPTKGVTR